MVNLTRFTTAIRAKLLSDTYKEWISKNKTVLDVGCGDGILSSIIIENFSVKLTGCDIENYLRVQIPFVLTTGTRLSQFKDKSFDVVMLNDVLHHMSFVKQEQLLKEALRVGKHVLIFEVEPTIIGAFADWTINKFHNFTMEIPFTFRSHDSWITLFKNLYVRYEYKKIERPLFYPFIHQGFHLFL